MKKDKILLLIIMFASLILGIGYATVNSISLSITGNSVVATNGTFGIISVNQVEVKNLTASETHTATSVELSLSFSVNKNDTSATDEHSVTYQVVIYNDSIQPFAIGPEVFSPQITTAASNGESLEYTYEPIGVNLGEEIGPKQTKQFNIKVTLTPSGGVGNYSAGVNTSVQVQEVNTGVFTATLTGSTNGDLTGSNTVTPFTVSLLNSFSTSKTYNFALSNPNFQVCDANGNALANQTIAAETENQTFTFYIKNPSGMSFPKSPQTINVYLVPTDGTQFSIGVVSIAVNVDQTMTDNTDPEITSLTVTKGNTTRTLAVNWAATDNIGIDHYDVYLYRSNGQEAASMTGLTTTTYTFSNVQNGTYYITLIAYDSRNSATSSTESVARTWTYNVTISCSNCSANPNGGTVEAGGTYKTTFSGSGNYNAPSSMGDVYMYDSTTGVRSKTTAFNYNNSQTQTNQFVITGVTGDLEINAAGVDGGCLVKGTKILLANGKTKNVEDIKYDDLLAVWNYDTGSLTYEYPLWIEKAYEIESVIRITFSDGSNLEIVYNHSLYDTDLNLFVDMLSDNTFHIGSNIAKLNPDGTLKSVKITNIEQIPKKTTYYFIGSTTYYNIIANDFLTTDRYTAISNLYGFIDNAKWPESKYELLADSKNLVSYDLFKDLLPHYLFVGFRVQEAGILFNNMGTDFETFAKYINTFITSDDYLIKPIQKNGFNYWMVTTSLDMVSDSNKGSFLQKEGSTFRLPKSAKVKKWYSTSENKYYLPGEYVVVNHGMHFEAIY